MLVSIVLTLHPTAPVNVPVNLGRATHAWFLDQVGLYDAALAERLHEPNQERPFTVSNLWGAGRPRSDAPDPGKPQGPAEVTLTPDQPCFLRLSAYEAGLAELLHQKMLPGLPQSITLAGATLKVQSVDTGAAQHPWAGQTTFAALLQENTLSGPPPPGLTLRFGSPTVFRSQESFMPLPLPRLVFEGLVRRWNATAPLALPAEVARYADECMAISRYRLHTERVTFGETGERGMFPGFVGQVSYSFRVKDRYWMGLVHTLAAFALYAGVGRQTTMGLGQVKRRS